MNNEIVSLLEGKLGYNVFPFMWVHGESEDRYRQIVRKIKEANINAICVEARPHKDYAGPTWWRDMDIILDEAKKNNMKVWILDDSHFPTGFACGKVKNYPDNLRRVSIVYNTIKAKVHNNIDLSKYFFIKKDGVYKMTDKLHNNSFIFKDDRLLTVAAFKDNERIDLTNFVKDNVLVWDAPSDGYTIELVYETKNAGTDKNYINMMIKESCKIQIDEVYEPHYAHYKDEFGKTIAGFFSDEPYIGNGPMYKFNIPTGSNIDMPYSSELDAKLKELWKDEVYSNLLYIWNSKINEQKAAKVRYEYIDAISRLVEEDFSKQIGSWCKDHGVLYIGHLIEDQGSHMRTGSGLAHYFRGLSGQHMAGVDVIGGQVEMFNEGKREQTTIDKFFGRDIKDGKFWHNTLAKLGGSMAELQPEKQGRCMCEIFGNYGWAEGTMLERYLLDHVFVRGVNRLVPHAFTCKDYPELDCPPHFYAQGHNAEYRHFGKLMQYADRMCELLSSGKNKSVVAIYYNAEADWIGNINPYMDITYVAEKLLDNQIDFVFLPIDVLLEKDRYYTTLDGSLKVNGKEIKLLIVPETKYISDDLANNLKTFKDANCKVVFINNKPECVLDKEYKGNDEVVRLEEIADYIDKNGYKDVKLSSANNRIRVMHYSKDNEMYFINNEGKENFTGTITLNSDASNTGIYEYDAFDNKCYKVDYKVVSGKTVVNLDLKSIHSMLLVLDKADTLYDRVKLTNNAEALDKFDVSICESVNYPNFKEVAKDVIVPNWNYSNKNKKFSGFVSYEAKLPKLNKAILEISEANDAVEVFINDKSLGIQVLPPFTYDLSGLLVDDENKLRIEVASTNDRAAKVSFLALLGGKKEKRKVGILGDVKLYK